MTKESHKIILKKKRKFWHEHIKAWSESGMTQAEYCRQSHLSSKSFGYWKRKQKKKDENITFYPVPSNQMVMPNNENQLFSLRLIVDDRFKIEVGDEFVPATLGKLVQSLGVL